SKLGLKSSSVFPFAPVNRTMFVDRKGGSEMRAALARPRRHRGTENATIALRDSVLATKLLATASIRRRSTHPLIFGAVIFGVGSPPYCLPFCVSVSAGDWLAGGVLPAPAVVSLASG